MPREFELITSVPVPARSGNIHLYQSMNLADARPSLHLRYCAISPIGC